MAKQKKRNPQDTTLRNLRAMKKRLDVIERRVDALEGKGRTEEEPNANAGRADV
jgi:tetrahydromethanopterin S-methyltransferase subunit G